MHFEGDDAPLRLATEIKKEITRSHKNLYRLAHEVKLDYAKLRDFMEGEITVPRSTLLKLASKLGLSLQQVGKG
jgi:hypothetical protein